MLSDTDSYLVNAIQRGEYQAFELLFNGYYAGLCKYAGTFLHSKEAAEDLVSDLFVKIWEQPQVLSVNVSLKGYLYRSVYNACMNLLTRRRIKFSNLDAETVNKLYALMPQTIDETPATKLFLEEMDNAIENAIGKLPVECGKIFVMSRKGELSHREIATQLHISENTVKVQIYRALSKLRQALKEYL